MSRNPNYSRGAMVCGWRLKELLGVGGNGEVWMADRAGQEVALKILHRQNPESEPYRRFMTETRVLSRLRDQPGVLPLLHSSLPDTPSRSDPAWLAMPVATPIRDVVPAEAPLRTAVEAIASIGGTLASLSEEHRLNHRDIKPENLYRHGDQWCVGDFGLVEDPAADEVTETGRLLGPRFYLAPEIFRADNSSWSNVDVYALAKTLWVLSTGQRYPPPGHLTREYEHFRLGFQIQSDNRVPYLESLIARATHPDPAARPSMREFSEELSSWLEGDVHRPDMSLLEQVRNRVLHVVEQRLSVEQQRQVLKDHVGRTLMTIGKELRRLGAALELTTRISPVYGQFVEFEVCGAVVGQTHLPNVYYHSSIASRISAPRKSGGGLVDLASGIGVCVTTSGTVHMIAAHVVTTVPAKVIDVWHKSETAHMESAMEARVVKTLTGGLEGTLEEAIDEFVRELES